MSISVICQQHPFPIKKGRRGIWSAVCFSGGMGSKSGGLLRLIFVPQIKCFLNNSLISIPTNTDEIEVLEALDILKKNRKVV